MREALRDWIDIQIVAFPQSGVMTEAGAPDLMAAAIMAGADLVGGLDPAGFDGDVKGQLDIVFGLAEAFGKGIDIHLHDFGETGAAELRDIAERTIAAGLKGGRRQPRLRARDGRAASVRGDRRCARARRSRDHDLMSAVRAGAAGEALRARGVTVFAGSDNIRDCWSPYGNGDMLDRAAIIAQRHEMYTNRELADAFALATSEADKALGDPQRGLRVGAVADLVAMEASSVADAVVNRPPRSMVLRAGRIAAERGVPSAALAAIQAADASVAAETEAEAQLRAVEQALRAELGTRRPRHFDLREKVLRKSEWLIARQRNPAPAPNRMGRRFRRTRWHARGNCLPASRRATESQERIQNPKPAPRVLRERPDPAKEPKCLASASSPDKVSSN